ncbi:MAG: hypothetical protein DIU78_011040 [Pseudomonadota bacterium]|nr:MAG: hypothetical protein DIU78_06730 [Pseudomonadota bacterium]
MALALACLALANAARAQACCAGAAAITPGRLELHETALVGMQARASAATGTYSESARFNGMPNGAAELEFRQDVFASVRWLRRGQTTLMVPFVESWRRAQTTGAEFGGGLGDVNLAARYDVVRIREFRAWPGIGVLAGLTLPTGRPPESTKLPLGSDATGVGAVQISAGIALEQRLGDVLVSGTGLVAQRTSRRVSGVKSTLGTQLTAILGVAVAPSDTSAVAVVVDYTHEGDARLDDRVVPNTSSRRLRLSTTLGLWPSDEWRVLAGLFLDPPLDSLGKNESAFVGGSVGVIRSFL